MKKVHTYQTTSPSHGNKSIREVLKAKVLLLMITAFFTLFIGHSATAQHCPNPCGWNGVGSASQPFIIATLADLNCLANAVNSGIATYDSCFFELRDDIGLMLTAIGYDANHYFGGIFDGNGHTIEVEITSINRTPAGLFGYTDNSFSGGRATIKNLTITGSVRGRDDVAGLVGYAENTYIERCYNYATVSANGNAGGFVGRAENTYIERCYNYATVSANSNAGGFIGYTGHWSSVRNCTNYANITASNDNVGGIIGSYNSAGIQQSENSGNIRGRSYVGGIAGSSVGSGGIDINTNIGIVIGTGDYVGGIVGYMSLSSQLSPMKYCHNSGYVQGYGNYIGGIVGYNTGHIHDCLNTIPVYGPAASTTIGGIVGYNDAGIINNCYYDIQMYNGVGIGSGSSTTGATGMTTTEIINYATPLVPPWIFTPDLYPRVSSTTIGYLAASPVFLLDISPDLERADSVVTDFTASIGYIDDWQSPSRNGYVTFSGTDATIGSIPSSPQPDTLVAVLDNIIRVVPIDIYQPAPPPCSVSVERIMPADEKTNASATGGFLVQFKVTITPAPTTLTSSDIILSNGSLIGVAAIGTGVWLISINVSALGLTQSDTVRIDSVNVSPCGWTVPDTDSNQFFDIRKVFLNNAYLKVPTDGATNVPVTISPIKIGFTNTEIVTVIASPNVLLTPIGGTGVLYSATFNTSDNSLEFTPNAPLDYSTPYTVTILANTIKYEWQNTKTSNIVVGSFTTEADKICIVSIERYNPTTNDDGKTNATFLIFEITFESALSGTPNATHFIFENISGSPFVVSGGGA
ncbi:MAG: Ig-like domain-containing protein, partial [Ignavibacteria bacterium]|nr:Ig-like domain-containing protein [Ignavibacteria bacterium]